MLSPDGQFRSWMRSISSLRRLVGQPLSMSARLMTACNTASGVLIMPPQRFTLATASVELHLSREKTRFVKSSSKFAFLVFGLFLPGYFVLVEDWDGVRRRRTIEKQIVSETLRSEAFQKPQLIGKQLQIALLLHKLIWQLVYFQLLIRDDFPQLFDAVVRLKHVWNVEVDRNSSPEEWEKC